MKPIQKCTFAAMKPTVQLARAISCLHASSIACAADLKASLHIGNTEFSAQVCSDLRLISKKYAPLATLTLRYRFAKYSIFHLHENIDPLQFRRNVVLISLFFVLNRI